MSKVDTYRRLKGEGIFEYGSYIPAEEIRGAFNIPEIEYPALKEEIDAQELAELAVVDYIRNQLLNDGKYLKGERDDYRVLLPSENAAQVLSYMKSADNKLKRGLKLNKNTATKYQINHNDEARAFLKRESIKNENSS